MAIAHCNFCSWVLAMNTGIDVILPERRNQVREPGKKKYKVLYFLHGHNGDATQLLRYTCIEPLLAEEDVIVVFPETQRGFYTDGNHGYDWFTYLTEELPVIIGNNFPASREREDTYIAGISMGAFGALKAAIWRPDLYGTVASISGGFDVSVAARTAVAPNPDPKITRKAYACADMDQNFEDIFGSIDEYLASPNNLNNAFDALLSSGKQLPRFVLACGEQDFPYQQTLDMYKRIKEAGADVDFIGGEGVHNWEYYNKIMPSVLRALGLLHS